MKYLYLSLLLFCGFNTVIANSDCCSFTIQYLISAQNPPSEEELAVCYTNTGCDKRYYFAGKMINAYDNNDIASTHKFFNKVILAAGPSPIDDLNLRIIYLYARYLETMGEPLVAGMYYSYINDHSMDKTALSLLSKISLSNIYGSEDAKLLIIDKAIDSSISSRNLTSDEKISILVKSSNLVPNSITEEVFIKAFYAHRKSCSPELFDYFILDAELNPNFTIIQEARDYVSKTHRENSNGSSSNNVAIWNAILAQRSSRDGDYEAALKFAKLAVENKIGPFKSDDQLIGTIKELKSIPFGFIINYARNNLFQTRLGKGLPPVKNAFDIYEITFDRLLIDRLESVNVIVNEQARYIHDHQYTPLIVGTYLYQNTNDLSYLSRSISIFDGFSSGGSQYWTLARNKMRTDKRFAAAVARERALAEEMRYLAPGINLAEIRQKQFDFEGHREQMRENFSEFYEELTSGYKIDLQEVQDDLAEDTTGLAAFYQNDAILYRLFISPDTIEITSISERRSEALALTEELSETIPAGKSSDLTKKASRKLYQLLFAGLDGLLPERLHVVTTGKLENIPFAALRRDTADGPPRYLGVDCAISRQSSIREMQLLEELDLDPRYAQPLGMAPAFSNEFLQASELRQAGFKLPPLVYNTEEVQGLEDRSAGQYYYDATATINHYVQHASDYGIIHLATHAISSEADGLRSHLYLLDDDGQPTQLYASDVGDQTLNANLVVLSACETGGGGRHVNEGKIGLTKAYLAAGARSVVSSNWAVDDHATAELMGSFYERLENGDAPHEALQYSRKLYLERHPDAPPYKWAAFEAHGGMKPVNWKQQNSWWPSLGYGVGFAFFAVLLGSFFQKRRQTN